MKKPRRREILDGPFTCKVNSPRHLDVVVYQDVIALVLRATGRCDQCWGDGLIQYYTELEILHPTLGIHTTWFPIPCRILWGTHDNEGVEALRQAMHGAV